MFTGIVRGVCPIAEIQSSPNFLRYAVALNPHLIRDLQKGNSIAIDGVCQTVIDIQHSVVWFDAIEETLQRTTLKSLKKGDLVNIERAARMGDEIGGHLLSGHIFGTATIQSFNRSENNCNISFSCHPDWTKYLFPKGFIALNGASLTLVDVLSKEGLFSVHLIPETLKQTTFNHKNVGDLVNVEFDSQTQATVDTLERLYNHSLSR